MAMPDGFKQKIFEATPYPYNYVFIWNADHLEWFGEWIARGHNFDNVSEHIQRIRDEIVNAAAMMYWKGNNFPAVVYVPLLYHTKHPYAGHVPWVSVMRSLSHELMHLALTICENVDYNPIHEQEPAAYMMGRFMRDALCELSIIIPDLKTLADSVTDKIKHNIMGVEGE